MRRAAMTQRPRSNRRAITDRKRPMTCGGAPIGRCRRFGNVMQDSRKEGTIDMTFENNLYGLNERLFAEMDRLEAADGDDLQEEIGRAKALRELGQTVIANGNLMVSASREMTAQGQAVQVPKGLLGA